MKKLILLSALSALAMADFTLEYQMDDKAKQIVQYKDAKHVLITTKEAQGDSSGAQLIVGDKKYMVVNEHGKKRYMDMDAMMQQMKQLGSMFGGVEQPNPKESEPEFKVVKKGAKRKVAGIDAEVWTLEVNDHGHKERMNVSVTKDKKIVDAIHKYTDAMSGMDKQSQDSFSKFMNIADGYVAISFDGMKLVKYDNSDIPDSLFALPKGVDESSKLIAGKKSSTVKKLPLCPMVGSHGKAKQLSVMLKDSADGWKKIESGTCIEMMKMRLESAIYQKSNSYIYITLSINSEDEKGIVATYRNNNLPIKGLKRGKIEGNRYQTAYLVKAKQYAMDIRLKNAMLTLSLSGDEKVDLPTFAKEAFDLSKFVPVKKSKPTADDALKSLGNMFGGGQHGNGKAPNSEELQKAGEMLKGLFGK